MTRPLKLFYCRLFETLTARQRDRRREAGTSVLWHLDRDPVDRDLDPMQREEAGTTSPVLVLLVLLLLLLLKQRREDDRQT
mmetsp:Transcript_28742/g.72279  ORF Transcript_28742/g.72279 Transcript_28742/m.72279 type:complete len:81 (+) Transcript_28742:221-463(+)